MAPPKARQSIKTRASAQVTFVEPCVLGLGTGGAWALYSLYYVGERGGGGGDRIPDNCCEFALSFPGRPRAHHLWHLAWRVIAGGPLEQVSLPTRLRLSLFSAPLCPNNPPHFTPPESEKEGNEKTLNCLCNLRREPSDQLTRRMGRRRRRLCR